MTTTSKTSTASDVTVLLEDQKKINKYARLNAQMEDVAEDVKLKEKELLELEDAESELLLSESTSTIPFKFGQIFANLSTDTIQQKLDNSKMTLKNEIIVLKEKRGAIKEEMASLRRELYNKFGNEINLEVDDA